MSGLYANGDVFQSHVL